MMQRLASIVVVTIVLAFAPLTASAQLARVNAGGGVSLPFPMRDSGGNQWMIYPGGWCQIQGNQPIYGQGAMLMINGSQPGMRNNQARVDEKTGEVIMDGMNAGGMQVTRRVLLDKEGAYVRYID